MHSQASSPQPIPAEMAQKLRAAVALPEDQGSVVSTAWRLTAPPATLVLGSLMLSSGLTDVRANTTPVLRKLKKEPRDVGQIPVEYLSSIPEALAAVAHP